MNSRILGQTVLKQLELQADVEVLLCSSDAVQEYSEYRFGVFKIYNLWNPTGDEADGLFRGEFRPAIKTQLGASVPHINQLIDDVFYTERLQMVRAYLLQDAILVPHRDYVEFKEQASRMVRLHVPILTTEQCLHSEEHDVFHMRLGEVWQLDVSAVHSACNPTDSPRVSLVLDFQLDGDPIASLLRESPKSTSVAAPHMIAREPADAAFLGAIGTLKHIVNRFNYRDILQCLSRVHFYKSVGAVAMFEWLLDICRGSNDNMLLQKSMDLKRYLIEERDIGQRFEV